MQNDKFMWDEKEKVLFKPLFDFLKKILVKTNPKILEIGAHHGQDTLRFCKTFEDLDIYCFEPCEDNNYILNKVVSKIPSAIPEFQGTISIIKKAVCERHNKKSIFYRPVRTAKATAEYKSRTNSKDPMFELKKNGWISGNIFMDEEDASKDIYCDADGASLNKIKFHKNPSAQRGSAAPIAEEVVSTITLDGWDSQQDNEFYDLAWIDVQGGEKGVIDGATETLKKTGYVLMEHSQHMYEGALSRDATIEIMNKNGFEHYVDIDGDNLLFAKTPGWES